MANISLIKFARLVGANNVIGMAQTLGQSMTSPISVRDLVESFGPPLQPTNLRLFWDLNVAGQIIYHSPSEHDVPSNKTIEFSWDDPATLPVRKATRYEIRVNNANTGQPFLTSPFPVLAHTAWGSGAFAAGTRYSWSVVPINDFGQGPPSLEYTFQTAQAPAPSHPPATGQLTIRVSLSGFGQQRSITSIGMSMAGPGAPTGLIPFQISQDRLTGTAVVSLPTPAQGSNAVPYVVRATVAFHYNGLINPNSGSISGAEDTSVSLGSPVTILWTGPNRAAIFSIQYDGPNNVFTMTFDGLV